MKNLFKKIALIAFTVFAFTSCDKDDDVADENTGTVSFSAVLNEMLNEQNRQQVADLPDCSEADPAYVDVIVTGPVNIGSVAAPYRVDLVNAGGSFVTGEDEELTNIPAGSYELAYFVVYDVENNPIWIAPSAGNFEDYVAEPLPQSFDVESGVDNEVSVDVACFENRILNEFGNLFFSLDPHRAIEFCIVGNTCGAGDASFSTTVYSGSDDTGSLLYMDMANTAGEALCMALPDLDGEDQYYFEISMDGTVIRSGVITDADVKALHEGETNIDPYTFYEGDSCSSADSPDLFGTGGGDTGGGDGEVPEGSFTIPYTETFSTATAESTLADYGYYPENLSGETVAEPGTASLIENTFPTLADESVTETAYGIQYGYVNNTATTSNGTVDNIVRTSAFEATAGDYSLTYDVSWVKAHDNHSVEVYFSDDSADGSFESGSWTMIDEVSQTDLEADGVGRQEFQRRTATISTSGNFYVAFRFKAVIDAVDEGSRWRIDNIQVAADGSTGGGGAFTDYMESFDDFDASASYDPSYLGSKGFEQYQFTTFAENQNIRFDGETNGNYPSPDSGFQLTYFAETDATTPAGAEAFGDFDVVMVTPGQADADGDFTVNIDARRFFSETVGNVTWYWTNNYNPGEGFTEANWNSLGTDDAQDLNDSGNFLTKSFNIPSSSGTLYFAIRVEGSVDNGGTSDIAQDGNYRFRVRFDNLEIIQN